MAPKRAASPAVKAKASGVVGSAAVAPAARSSSPSAAPSSTTRAPSPRAVSNKSGPPAVMIADMILKGTGHDYGYSPTADYAAGKRVRSGRAYLPPVWTTVWITAAACVTLWSALYVLNKESGASEARSGDFASIFFAPFHAYARVDKTFAFASGATSKPSLRKALLEAFAGVGYGEAVFAMLYLFMTIGMEAPGASVLGLIATVTAAIKSVSFSRNHLFPIFFINFSQ